MASVPAMAVLELLRLVIVAEVVALLLLLGGLALTTAFRFRRRRQHATIEARWHGALRARFAQDEVREATDGLQRLPPRRRVATITALVGSLSSDMVAMVTGPADLADLLHHGRRWTRSRLWWRRLQGVRTLVQLGQPPAEHRAMLMDRRPEVRAEVAGWVAGDPEPTDIRRLLAMIDGDDRRCRFAAENALRHVGPAAVPALSEYLATEQHPHRPALALQVAAAVGDVTLTPVATAWTSDADSANRAAAATLLAAVGGDEAATRLLTLLDDRAPGVRAAAAAGLGRLGAWSAAPQLARSLHDEDWAVRRAAAVALRGLGPVGRLCLRRALNDPDPRVGEIARHVSDLPSSAVAADIR